MAIIQKIMFLNMETEDIGYLQSSRTLSCGLS